MLQSIRCNLFFTFLFLGFISPHFQVHALAGAHKSDAVVEKTLPTFKAKKHPSSDNTLVKIIQEGLEKSLNSLVAVKIHTPLPLHLLSLNNVSQESQLRIKNLTYQVDTQTFEATLVLLSDEKFLHTLKGSFQFQKRIPVLTKTLTRHTMITEQDISWQRVNDSYKTHNALATPDTLYGAKTTRALKAGTILTSAMLTSHTMMPQGTVVRVTYKKGPMTITANGGCLKKATKLGELAHVSNPFNPKGKPLWGILKNASEVRLNTR